MTFTPAEMTARRLALGLTVAQLARILDITPRTLRAWESGRDKPGRARRAEYEALATEHRYLATAIAERASDGYTPLRVPRGWRRDRPHGWYLTAAVDARRRYPELEIEIEWADGSDGPETITPRGPEVPA